MAKGATPGPTAASDEKSRSGRGRRAVAVALLLLFAVWVFGGGWPGEEAPAVADPRPEVVAADGPQAVREVPAAQGIGAQGAEAEPPLLPVRCVAPVGFDPGPSGVWLRRTGQVSIQGELKDGMLVFNHELPLGKRFYVMPVDQPNVAFVMTASGCVSHPDAGKVYIRSGRVLGPLYDELVRVRGNGSSADVNPDGTFVLKVRGGGPIEVDALRYDEDTPAPSSRVTIIPEATDEIVLTLPPERFVSLDAFFQPDGDAYYVYGVDDGGVAQGGGLMAGDRVQFMPEPGRTYEDKPWLGFEGTKVAVMVTREGRDPFLVWMERRFRDNR